jgi:hypothetical protein
MMDWIKGRITFERQLLSDFAANLAFGIVLVPTLTFILSVVALYFSWQINGWILVLPAVGAATTVSVMAPSTHFRFTLFGGLLMLHLGAGVIASLLYDYSWDGLFYHQEAIIRLSQGWNPLSTDAAGFGTGLAPNVNIFLDHYPKAFWLVNACTFKTFGLIEVGKLFNLTIWAAAACQVFAVLLRLTPLTIRNSFLIALLAAFNPVTIVQMSGFLTDGWMAGLFTILVVSLGEYIVRPGWRSCWTAVPAAILMINLKFTGLVYAVLVVGFAIGAALFLKKYRAGLRLAVVLGVTGIVSVVVLGYSPYVRNVREHGELFFPLRGEKPLDIMTAVRPANFADEDRLTRFVVGNFSRSEHVRTPQSTTAKVPFMIFPSEFLAWRADPEAGGFGPWFSGLLICSAVAVVLLLKNLRLGEMAGLALFCGGCVLATVFVHTEGWYARYAPQTWLLPLLLLVCLLNGSKVLHHRLAKLMIWLLVGNVIFICTAWAGWNFMYGSRIRQCLHEMAASPQPVSVELGQFQSLRERLSEARIRFEMVDDAGPPQDALRCRIPTNGEQAFWYKRRFSRAAKTD